MTDYKNLSNLQENEDEDVHDVFNNADLEKVVDTNNWLFKHDNQKFNIFNLYKARSGLFETNPEKLDNREVAKRIKNLQSGEQRRSKINLRDDYLAFKLDNFTYSVENSPNNIEKWLKNGSQSMKNIPSHSYSIDNNSNQISDIQEIHSNQKLNHQYQSNVKKQNSNQLQNQTKLQAQQQYQNYDFSSISKKVSQTLQKQIENGEIKQKNCNVEVVKNGGRTLKKLKTMGSQASIETYHTDISPKSKPQKGSYLKQSNSNNSNGNKVKLQKCPSIENNEMETSIKLYEEEQQQQQPHQQPQYYHKNSNDSEESDINKVLEESQTVQQTEKKNAKKKIHFAQHEEYLESSQNGEVKFHSKKSGLSKSQILPFVKNSNNDQQQSNLTNTPMNKNKKQTKIASPSSLFQTSYKNASTNSFKNSLNSTLYNGNSDSITKTNFHKASQSSINKSSQFRVKQISVGGNQSKASNILKTSQFSSPRETKSSRNLQYSKTSYSKDIHASCFGTHKNINLIRESYTTKNNKSTIQDLGKHFEEICHYELMQSQKLENEKKKLKEEKFPYVRPACVSEKFIQDNEQLQQSQQQELKSLKQQCSISPSQKSITQTKSLQNSQKRGYSQKQFLIQPVKSKTEKHLFKNINDLNAVKKEYKISQPKQRSHYTEVFSPIRKKAEFKESKNLNKLVL